jgi:glycosyltransferase involved in cell wall biosynthesis
VHRDFLIKHHNLSPEQVLQTRNGIDFTRFAAEVERNPKKVVYSSSPDRGLPVLLSVWPEIRKRVPDAELHVFYGFFNWRKIAEARNDQEQLRGIDFLEKQLADLASHGVHNRGKVDQVTLAHEFTTAGVWAHPTWFTETSCLTAMEAQAAGLRIVTSSIAALNETVGDYGVLLDGDWLTPEYQARFVDEVVRAIEAPEGEWKKAREEIKARAFRDFDLDELAEDWVRMFDGLIADVKVRPLVPYIGRADFVREVA